MGICLAFLLVKNIYPYFASDYSLMTEKQEKILSSALRLFAERGYAATSTAKVAKAAGVSEGLIFRHFKNKEGLLAALLEQGSARIEKLSEQISAEENPRDRLRMVIDMPFTMEESEYPFWKLLYALKWQTDAYDSSGSDQFKEILIKAFADLHYKNPAAEAELVLITIEGLATAVLLRKPQELSAVQELLKQRYQL